MALLARIVRKIGSRIYRRQVGYEFPVAMVTQHGGVLPPLPDGYRVRQPPHGEDLTVVAALLNQEPGFGAWTVARIERELLSKLAHPQAAILVMHGDEPVAVLFATDESTRRKKIAHGMYLYVVPAHRGHKKLAAYLMYSILAYCMAGGYDQVLGFTDPTRFSALLLYLSNGVKPVYSSLSCYWHWRKIYQRLGPALQRAARSRASGQRRSADAVGAGQINDAHL